MADRHDSTYTAHMQTSYFITSTGTGVGKTYVAAALIRQARAAGKNVVAVKPLISGFDRAKIAETDTGVLIDALGLQPTSANIERVSPWRYAAPLAPSVAARREGREIDFERLVSHSRETAESDCEFMLVEGVGGVMAPIDDMHTVLDWIQRVGMPALLVVGSYLGAFSHTLTALEAIRIRNIRLAAIVVSESLEPSLTLDETVCEITKRSRGAPVIGLRRESNGHELRALIDAPAPQLRP
jgi:dethiobiotin synthetase